MGVFFMSLRWYAFSHTQTYIKHSLGFPLAISIEIWPSYSSFCTHDMAPPSKQHGLTRYHSLNSRYVLYMYIKINNRELSGKFDLQHD